MKTAAELLGLGDEFRDGYFWAADIQQAVDEARVEMRAAVVALLRDAGLELMANPPQGNAAAMLICLETVKAVASVVASMPVKS